MLAPRCLVVQPINPAGIGLLEQAGVEIVYATSQSMAVVENEIAGCAAVLTRNAGLSAKAIEQGTHLQVIANHGAGLNRVDVQRATELGIPVIYTPGTNARSVAEHTLLLAMAVCRRLIKGHKAVKSGDWSIRYLPGAMELQGQTLGIIGLGRIGREVADIASKGFGMNIAVFSLLADDGELKALGYKRYEELKDLLRAADIVTLHCPAIPGEPPLIDRQALGHFRQGAILINTARAELVDSDALYDALESGHLAGAGLDVFNSEPPDRKDKIVNCDKIVLSPHMGAATDGALERMSVACAEQIISVLGRQRPKFLANPEIWEKRRVFEGR